MSNSLDPFSNPENIQTIQKIDQLNLPIMQKHHLKILTHVLIIMQSIYVEDDFSTEYENLLRTWCDKQSGEMNDKKFNEILFKQLLSAAKKLNVFSQSLGKNIKDLEIQDLINLVQVTNSNMN